jgi:phage/plasmid-associated DNA primase
MLSTQNSFQLTEIYDKQKLLNLINNGLLREDFDDESDAKYRHYLNDRSQLHWIYDNINAKCELVVNYETSNKNEDIGRFYVLTPASYTLLPRKYRNYLCGELCYDFDMKNAHLSILCELIDKYNLTGCDNIKRLFKNYDKLKFGIMNAFHFTSYDENANKNNFKKLMLSLLFGFGCDNHFDNTLKKFDIDKKSYAYSNNEKIFTFIQNYINELKSVTQQLRELNIYDIDVSHKDFNKDGSWLSYCIQTVEADIICGLKNYLIKINKKIVLTYEYDGLKLVKIIVDTIGFKKIENEINIFLKINNHNLISIVNKSMDEKVYIAEDVKECGDLINEPITKDINEPIAEDVKECGDLINEPIAEDINEPIASLNLVSLAIAEEQDMYDEEPAGPVSTKPKCLLKINSSPTTVNNTFSPITLNPESQCNAQLDILKDIENQVFTSGLLSKLFIELYTNDWISKDNILYGWNGIYWESGNDVNVKISKQIDQNFVEDLLKYSQTLPKQSKYHLEIIGNLIFKISKIRQIGFRNDIIKDIITFSSTNIIFDANPYIFAFTNKIFNLKTGSEIEPNKNDFISITTGYDWVEPTQTHIETVNEIIKKIQPTKETRDFYLSILSTGLIGIQLQYIFILTGKGGNGKSILDDLMLSATGNYGYKMPSKFLSEELKTGANPEANNLNNKRYVLGQEPPANKQIVCSVFKEITGGQTLNARGLYSSNCVVNLLLTLFLECNKLPNLDEVNEAVERRLRVINFLSKFINDDNYDMLLLTGDTIETLTSRNIYRKNSQYTTPEFRNAHRCALIKILMNYAKAFIENNNEISSLPHEVKISSSNYLKQSDPIYEWFIENYERKDKNIIYEADVYDDFKCSEFYSKSSKKTQRDNKKDKFIENLKSNLFLSNILNPKSRNEYIDLELTKKTRITKDGFYGWCKKINEIEDV